MSTAQDVVRIVRAEVGYKEGFSNGHWNNKEKYAAEVPGMAWVSDGGYAWCDIFANWGFLKAGLVPGQHIPAPSASCAVSVAGWRAMGRFDRKPQVGDQVFYGTGGSVHTGIVTAVRQLATDVEFDSTEGNTNITGSPEGDGVYNKTHLLSNPYVYGFGHPIYENEDDMPAYRDWSDADKKALLNDIAGVVNDSLDSSFGDLGETPVTNPTDKGPKRRRLAVLLNGIANDVTAIKKKIGS